MSEADDSTELKHLIPGSIDSQFFDSHLQVFGTYVYAELCLKHMILGSTDLGFQALNSHPQECGCSVCAELCC